MYKNSKLVYAERYELEVNAGSKKVGNFSTTGQRKLTKKGLVDRIFVTQRIAVGIIYKDGKAIEGIRSNNELYVIDEEKTAELMKLRDENVIKNAEKAKKENLGQSDLVDAIKNLGVAQPATGGAPDQTVEIDELKAKNKKLEESAKKQKEVAIKPVTDVEIGEADNDKVIEIYIPDYSKMSVDQLRKICDDKNIKYHHKALEGRLIELIEENKS
jgi:hypothetical protein